MPKRIKITMFMDISPKSWGLFQKITKNIEYLIPKRDQQVLGIKSIYGVEVKEIDR